MSFLDYILAGFGVFEIKDEILKENSKWQQKTQRKKLQEFPAEKQEFPKKAFTPKRNIYSKNKLAIFCPETTEDVIKVSKFLSTNQPLMLNITFLPKDILQRSMDFVLGSATAVGANMQSIGKGLFLFAPKGTELVKNFKKDNDEF